jgi:hypothetical protein
MDTTLSGEDHSHIDDYIEGYKEQMATISNLVEKENTSTEEFRREAVVMLLPVLFYHPIDTKKK